MNRSTQTHPHLTRTRRRALAVPFVITFAAAGAACGTEAKVVPAGGQPVTTDVISNPAEPGSEPEQEVTISNPAEPPVETTSNPAEPDWVPPEDDLLVIANPAFPGDG